MRPTAPALARKKLPDYAKKARALRDVLQDGILRSTPNTESNGPKAKSDETPRGHGRQTQRSAYTTNIAFHGIESEARLILLDQEGLCASSGSAFLADSDEPSHVIKAMKPKSAASR
jgi:cysteine desulfurase